MKEIECYCPECGWEGTWKESIGGDNWCPECSNELLDIEEKE